MMQAELEAEVWRNVGEIRYLGRPLIEQGSVVVLFGPGEHELVGGGIKFVTDGTPDLDLIVYHYSDKRLFDVHVTRIGKTPFYSALEQRPIPDAEDEVLPPRIFVDDDVFIDIYRSNLPLTAQHYAVYAEVCRELKPRSILEIGVRAGYSAWTMLSAVPDATYIGLDADNGTNGGVAGYFEHAEAMLRREYPQASVNVWRANSQRLISLDRRYDLIHIDGAHNHDEALRDMELCAPFADYLLVDDTASITTVRTALDEFQELHGFPAWRYETWHGMVLIDTRAAEGKFAARYCPEIFNQSSLEDAKSIILQDAPNLGLVSDHRWVKETEWLMKTMIFPTGTIIDIGCGIGRLSKPLVRRHRVIGIDGSEQMRAGAEEYVGDPERFTVISPEIFQKKVFHRDLVAQGAIAIWVLQHMMPDDLRSLVRAVWEALEPGAPFYTMESNYRCVPVLFGRRFGWLDDHFSVPEFLEKNGFLLQQEEEMPVEIFPAGLATLRRWIRRR